jgi:hypothetical protein
VGVWRRHYDILAAGGPEKSTDDWIVTEDNKWPKNRWDLELSIARL